MGDKTRMHHPDFIRNLGYFHLPKKTRKRIADHLAKTLPPVPKKIMGKYVRCDNCTQIETKREKPICMENEIFIYGAYANL